MNSPKQNFFNLFKYRFVARTVRPLCRECETLIVEPAEAKPILHDDNDLHNRLIINKDKGGLFYPTPYLVKIITAAEKIVRQHTKVGDTNKLTIQKLNYYVLNQIGGPPNNFLQHAKDTQDGLQNHYYTLVRNILERYFQTRQNHISKRCNQALHPSKKRNKLTRLVIFSNQ